VVTTLTGLVLYAAIDHAAHETICCAPRAVVIIADKVSPIWTASIFALIGVLSLALYALFRMLVGIATGRGPDMRLWFIDCIFGLGAIVGVNFVWVVAMGHSEPNWIKGFHETWISLLVISGVALMLTWDKQWKMAARVSIWVAGVLLAVLIPRLLTSVQIITAQGQVIYEQHGMSAKYVFAVAITCCFWIFDVCLSRSKHEPIKNSIK
jgi:hypothetical protein